MVDAAGQVLFRDSGTAVGLFANVLVTVAAGTVSHPSMTAALEGHRLLRDRHRGGYAHMIVTAATARMPNAEFRAEMQKTTREFSPHMLAHAIVLEGEGLIAASFRMVTQTMLLAVPKAHPHRAFGHVGAATMWVREQCQKVAAIDVFRLDTFIGELRVRI